MRWFTTSLMLLISIGGYSSNSLSDTLHLQPRDLDIKDLQMGNYTYLIAFQKPGDSVAYSMTLEKIKVSRETYHDRAAIVVCSEWDRDTIYHQALTVFDAQDFSTLLHHTYWAPFGYTMIFDFESKVFSCKPGRRSITDSAKMKSQAGFDSAVTGYFYNWHDDLILYSMLPYRENRTFRFKYYEPGFGKPQMVDLTVTGSEYLKGNAGEKIDCWVLYFKNGTSVQRWWISKKGKEVLKEEDRFSSGIIRYEYKLGVSTS